MELRNNWNSDDEEEEDDDDNPRQRDFHQANDDNYASIDNDDNDYGDKDNECNLRVTLS